MIIRRTGRNGNKFALITCRALPSTFYRDVRRKNLNDIRIANQLIQCTFDNSLLIVRDLATRVITGAINFLLISLSTRSVSNIIFPVKPMSHKKRTKLYGSAPDDQLPLSNPESRKNCAYIFLLVEFIDLVRRYNQQGRNGCRFIRERLLLFCRQEELRVLPFRAIIALVFPSKELYGARARCRE